SGSLLVANGNGNHAFDGGTVVAIRKSYLDAFFAKALTNCDSPAPDAACDDDVSLHPGDVFSGVVMVGNYTGPLALNDDATRAFTGARDTNTLSAVAVATDGSLSCAPGAGATPDCRQGLVDLGKSGVLNTSGVVAALDMADPSQVVATALAGSGFIASVSLGQGTAVGPMLYDPVRRQLVMGGCFQRFPGTGAGEPGTGRCTNTGFNYLRFLDVNAQLSGQPTLVDLFGDVRSVETTAMAFGDLDPATQAPTTLWVTMRAPDVLAQVELPLLPSVPPRVRRVVPLPVSPADVLRIPRPGGKSDLIAVAAEKIGSVAIYDTGLKQVVGQVERLGDSPFALKLLSEDATSARLVSTVFRSCRLALIEVPFDAPWNAALRGRVGKCQ
ncbi:MAG TPA: hypothetical protein VJX66_06040, partial [Amycolatopsis sp.]|nr:hypothetical protein [Amycolatopsis sp.]